MPSKIESREFSSAQTAVRPPPLVCRPRKLASLSTWPETAKLTLPWPPVLAYCSASLAPGVPLWLSSPADEAELERVDRATVLLLVEHAVLERVPYVAGGRDGPGAGLDQIGAGQLRPAHV